MESSGPTHGRSALVLFGTETGTSQDLAEETGRVLERLRFHVDVTDCDNATHSHFLTYDLTVILISTTGQGDFPSNARKLWMSLLRKRLPATLLTGVRYALVGLCDSSYLKFNYAARKLGKRLRQLGADEIIETCEADEQDDDGTDGLFLPWLNRFVSVVLGQYPLPPGVEAFTDAYDPSSKWLLQKAEEFGQTISIMPKANGISNGDYQPSPSLTDSFTAHLEVNNRVTPASHWQDVRFLRLRTRTHIDYLPGDALAISPENMSEDVATLSNLMGWNDIADCAVVVRSNYDSENGNRLNSPPVSLKPNQQQVSFRELLTRYLDINAIPRRSFFAAIAKYATDSTQKERLLEFTEPQYLDEYYDYATRPRRSIVEILQEFDSVKIPWQEAINVLPSLRPRQFSLASGGSLKTSGDGSVFELLVAIVKYKTVIKRVRQGVCTRYLAQLPVGTTINVALRTEGRFCTNDQIAHNNHLLIGAGTGIAPLRSLIHEKASRNESRTSTILIFGCRKAQSDYFFSEEWQAFSSRPPAHPLQLKVHPAFSRDQARKFYVQDQIREQRNSLRPLLIDHKTVVIVCGASGQMPKAVRQALIEVLSWCPPAAVADAGDSITKNGHMTVEDAEKFIDKLEKEGRYKQETWS